MTTPKAIVRVSGAQDVDIRAFTIEGPGGGPCDSLEFGVRVDGGGSADIEFNHITHIRDNPFSGCQNGVAVDAGRVLDSTAGTATVKYNAIDDYQKVGVLISNAGSHGDVEFNKITGAGPTATIGQNGVQISGGADAVVAANDVSGNVYTPQTVEATGMIVVQAGSVLVAGNRVHDNDAGIVSLQNTGNVRIKNNWTWNSTYDGIEVNQSSQIRVEDNNTSKNDQGIGVYTSDHNVFDDNNADDNDTNGLFADTDTSRNTFTSNEASGNGSFDCRDDSHDSGTAGTANFWIGNTGTTSSPAGICRRPRGRW
jgi:parallel beta-helix repeat protein